MKPKTNKRLEEAWKEGWDWGNESGPMDTKQENWEMSDTYALYECDEMSEHQARAILGATNNED